MNNNVPEPVFWFVNTPACLLLENTSDILILNKSTSMIYNHDKTLAHILNSQHKTLKKFSTSNTLAINTIQHETTVNMISH